MKNNFSHFTPNPTELDIDQSLREVAEHGNLLFPVGVHYTQHQKNREIVIHKHWHRELEILYVAEGAMSLEIENQTFHMQKGDICCIPPNYLHSAYQYQHEDCDFYAVVFDPFFIASYTNDHIQQAYIRPILQHPEKFLFHITEGSPHSEALQDILQHIFLHFNQHQYVELLIKAKLLELFYFFYLIKPSGEEDRRSKEDLAISLRIKKIVLYIEDHFREPFSLTDISEYLGISKEHFCRFFKKNFHISFSDYLTRHRISHAEHLLQSTDSTILDIALECGFDSGNYFTIVFKKTTGETPSQFRKRLHTKTG